MVLISGFSGTGKSRSLKNIQEQDKWIYINAESNKPLPFKNNFKNITVSNPLIVPDILDDCIQNQDKVNGIVLDSITFLMDMVESQLVLTASDSRKAWQGYSQFFKQLVQEKFPEFKKPIIVIAHTKEDYDEQNQRMRTYVPIKGALKNQGVEAYFTTVVSTKAMSLLDLEPYESNLLNINDDERALGYKHVFQTKKTKESLGETIKSPEDLFTRKESFMDNDVALLLKHLKAFYGV